MSNPDQDHPFAAGFMDDYFAEADEHMIAVRRSLLTVEGSLGATVPASTVDELFRSFHSLKGISAMVDLREAELLAHQMESCLRAVRQGRLRLTSVNFEVFVDAVRMLERVIATRRASAPPPSIDAIVEKLESLAQPDDGASHPAPPASSVVNVDPSSPEIAGARRWRVTFVPSPQLVERGVKVDTVRARLLQIGNVLSVTPKVVPGGGISFEFDVQTNDDAQLERWRDDGLSYELLNAPAAAAVAPDTGDEERPLLDFTLGGLSNVVRVDLARLDDLMRLVGEMVVTRSRLEDTLSRVEAHVSFQEWRALQDHSARIERNLRDLREGVMRVRLVPVSEIFRRMPFVVRDLARDSGKRVQLALDGQGAEIDKFLVERMMDPVLHLVRNAISHGIETPDQRIAAGKSPDGTIRLSAATVGETVVIEIADDGGGIDLDSVAARARTLGVMVPDGELDSRALLDIICASGFSTRDEADRASGRGVGMAVVRDTVEGLGGVLTVDSRPGRGTTLRMTLPLTLAITDAIVAHVGEQIFAVPQSAVREVVEVDASLLRSFEHNELMPYRGGTLPMVRLSDLFGLRPTQRPRYHAVVVGAGQAAIGLIVDRVAGQREVVVKAITDPLIRVTGVSGATEPGDGRVVLILDVAALSRTRRSVTWPIDPPRRPRTLPRSSRPCRTSLARRSMPPMRDCGSSIRATRRLKRGRAAWARSSVVSPTRARS
jgi:two-component system, chemotaxis family, sensor kinase CheA